MTWNNISQTPFEGRQERMHMLGSAEMPSKVKTRVANPSVAEAHAMDIYNDSKDKQNYAFAGPGESADKVDGIPNYIVEGSTLRIFLYGIVAAADETSDQMNFVGVRGLMKRVKTFKGKTIEININSPGGNLLMGLGLYQVLREARKKGQEVITKIEGIAGSAASLIFLAGTRRQHSTGGYVFIHPASILTFGSFNAADCRDMAAELETLDDEIAEVFVANTDLEKPQAMELMMQETFLGSEKSLELGFATEAPTLPRPPPVSKNSDAPLKKRDGGHKGIDNSAILATNCRDWQEKMKQITAQANKARENLLDPCRKRG